ncbi:hypothetical protein B0187_04140 [Haemophilus paracuniculus]|uniref:Uncharacterized protein n=1 Tax=Haemophilus paracuniculus TaxID=734 RepID=A0A1T0AU02_9PAST|nr:hypothetical protein B0187_04140 [Haemophilus paracuniculus]
MINVFETVFLDFFIGILIIALLILSILWVWFLPIAFLIFILIVIVENIRINKRMKKIEEKAKKASEVKYIIIK